MRALVAFFLGALFATGLGIGGMLQPGNLIGFLDFFGAWNPKAMFVMGGAIGVFLPSWMLMRRRVPLLGGKMPGEAPAQLDARLFLGSGLFGVGWALAGLCPGPSVTVLATGHLDTIVFFLSMAAGMLATRWVSARC